MYASAWPRCVAPARRGIVAILLVGLCLTVSAADTVYGRSQAQRCYHFARSVSRFGAVATCTEALETQKLDKHDRAATFSNRGVLHARNGDLAKALADQNRALELHPASVHALINRANALMRMELYDAAIADYELALFYSEGRSAIAYYNRAIVYKKRGEKARAKADLRRALELRPGSRRYRDALARFD